MLLCANELAKIVVDAGGVWSIGVKARCIQKKHIMSVFSAFGKPFPGPENTWREWVSNVQDITGWDSQANKFNNL